MSILIARRWQNRRRTDVARQAHGLVHRTRTAVAHGGHRRLFTTIWREQPASPSPLPVRTTDVALPNTRPRGNHTHDQHDAVRA